MEEKKKDEINDMAKVMGAMQPSMPLPQPLLKEDKKFYDGVKSMEKLKIKGKLISDTDVIFGNLSKNKKVYLNIEKYGKKYVKYVGKSVYKDFKKGMRKIDESIKVYVELPEQVMETLGI